MNGPRVSASFSGSPAIGDCVWQSALAAASWPGVGGVGVGVQPANALDAPAVSEITTATAPAVPAALASRTDREPAASAGGSAGGSRGG